MKKIYSIQNGRYHTFDAKINEPKDEQREIELFLDDKLFATLINTSRRMHDKIVFEDKEVPPHDLQNAMEVWNNFDFYFNMLSR